MTENDEDVFINTETIQKPVLYASLGFSNISRLTKVIQGYKKYIRLFKK